VGLAETPVTVNLANGSLKAMGAGPSVQRELAGTRDFVTDPGTKLGGSMRAIHGGLALYSLRPPPRIASLVSGVYPDGWMGADAAYTRFAARPAGRLTVSLSRKAWRGPDVPGHVRVELLLRRGPRAGQAVASRTWTIHSGARRSFTLRTPSARFTATVHIQPTFSPSQFGQGDPRQLGAQVTFIPRASPR
jgi:hypothetical protein